MTSDRRIWMEYTYNSRLTPEAAQVYEALPDEIRQNLANAAFSLYNFGFQHGRSYSGCGIEPTYYVADSHLQIVDQSTDIA